jgi:hypothetical protein
MTFCLGRGPLGNKWFSPFAEPPDNKNFSEREQTFFSTKLFSWFRGARPGMKIVEANTGWVKKIGVQVIEPLFFPRRDGLYFLSNPNF